MSKKTEINETRNLDGFKKYSINFEDCAGIVALWAGNDNPEGKANKSTCDVDGHKVRYLFETVKGALLCSGCLKVKGFSQKQIDKMYNVAYYDRVGISGGAVKMTIEERQNKLAELF